MLLDEDISCGGYTEEKSWCRLDIGTRDEEEGRMRGFVFQRPGGERDCSGIRKGI